MHEESARETDALRRGIAVNHDVGGIPRLAADGSPSVQVQGAGLSSVFDILKVVGVFFEDQFVSGAPVFGVEDGLNAAFGRFGRSGVGVVTVRRDVVGGGAQRSREDGARQKECGRREDFHSGWSLHV